MIPQRRSMTTLTLLGMLVGFVNVDAFRLSPVPGMGSPSAPIAAAARRHAQTTTPGRRDASSAWRTVNRGLSMSSLSALDDVSATDEMDGGKPSRASVMDELDAILGDVQTVSTTPTEPSFDLLGDVFAVEVWILTSAPLVIILAVRFLQSNNSCSPSCFFT